MARTQIRELAEEWIALGMMVIAIGGGWILADEDLESTLHDSLQANTEDSFETAKQHIYDRIDLQGDSVLCVYSGTTVTLLDQGHRLWPDPDDGVQIEHTWASKANWAHEDDHFARDSVPGADLHHLYPVRRGINASRGNHPFGVPQADVRELRVDADGTLNHSGGGAASGSLRGRNDNNVVVFQPRAEHRGNVARAMFYMSIRYWMPIPEDMESVLRDWHTEDPVDDPEQARNDRIENIQRNRNPFIDDASLVDLIDDF